MVNLNYSVHNTNDNDNNNDNNNDDGMVTQKSRFGLPPCRPQARLKNMAAKKKKNKKQKKQNSIRIA